MLKFNLDDIISDDNDYYSNVEKLFDQIEENDIEIKKIKTRVEELKENINRSSKKINHEEKTDNSENSKNKKYDSKEIDVSSYIELLYCADSIEDLSTFLPKASDKNFDSIINALMLHLQREFVFFSKYLNELDISKEELIHTKQDLNRISRLKDLLLDYKESFIEEDKETIDNKQQLFYLQTSSGNYKILNDIKQIPIEYYDKLYILFNSLQNGRYKNLKVLSGSTMGSGYYEVRLPELRLTFMRLRPDTLCVMSAFLKKANKTRHHHYLQQALRGPKKMFDANKDYLMSQLDNPEFIESQNKLTENIYATLRTGANKIKMLESPNSGGDYNG